MRAHSSEVGTQSSGVLGLKFFQEVSWTVRMPYEPVTETADDAAGQVASSVRNRQKNDPIDSGLMPEEEIL
jgi:hypothetical protein